VPLAHVRRITSLGERAGDDLAPVAGTHGQAGQQRPSRGNADGVVALVGVDDLEGAVGGPERVGGRRDVAVGPVLLLGAGGTALGELEGRQRGIGGGDHGVFLRWSATGVAVISEHPHSPADTSVD
jgi:hypothetical protein